jgi:hypothetical protein
MRLNGIMGMIAVVCVAGVVSSEILGPMARLRFGRSEAFGDSGKRHSMRAEVAGDTFGFPPSDDPLLMLALNPTLPSSPHKGGSLPWPSFSAVAMTFEEGDGDDQPEIGLINFQTSLDGVSAPNALMDAVFTPATEPAFSPDFSPQPLSFTPPKTPAAAPEPASWLLLIFGVGGVGLALRRRRAQAAGRLPDGCASAALRD